MDGARLSTTPTGPTDAIGLLPLQVERTEAEELTASAEIDYFKYEFRPTPEDAAPMFPE